METIGETKIICPVCRQPAGNYTDLRTINYSLLILCCDHCGQHLVFIHSAGTVSIRESLPLGHELLENPILPRWVRKTFELVLHHVPAPPFEHGTLQEVDYDPSFFCPRCAQFFSVLPDQRPLYFGLILFRCPGCGISNAVYHYGVKNQWQANLTLGLGEADNRFRADLPDWLRSLILTSVKNVYGPKTRAVPDKPERPAASGTITDGEMHRFRRLLDTGKWPPD